MYLVADFVYPPVVAVIKSFWKYLDLRFSFSGEENIPQEGGAILAINHIGYLDFALVGTAVLPKKRYVRFMAKKEIFNNNLAGPLMRGMHHISVDRGNGSASFVAALRALRKGGTFKNRQGRSVPELLPLVPRQLDGGLRPVFAKHRLRKLRRGKFQPVR